MIEFRVLGGLTLRDDGREVTRILVQPRRLALLAFLAAAFPRRFHRRDTLLALFWPELDEHHARTALRQALHVLRGSLGARAVLARGHEEVALDPRVVWCDADEFCAATEAGRPEEALELYRGELLEGFHIARAPEFEQWLETRRAELRARAREAAVTLLDRCELAGNATAATIWARRATRLAPLDRNVLRRLIALLDASGDRTGAVEAYVAYAGRLARELELAPPLDLDALIAGVRTRAAVVDAR
jgi:serine/threonine-protein kinase